MNIGKLFLIAGLVGAVALIGCSDDNGTGGTGGTAGTGGTGGGADPCTGDLCDDSSAPNKEACKGLIEFCNTDPDVDLTEEECNEEGKIFCSIDFGGAGGAGGEGGAGGASARVVRVFVTSGSSNGDLGGLSGADTICTNAATAENLGGTWTAWLSLEATETEAGVPAIGRISAGRYERLDGTVVANDKVDLTNGSLNAPINWREDGTPIPAQDNDRVWTGTNYLGSWLGNTSCNRWTSSDAARDAQTGQANADDETWTDYTALDITCDNTYRLYCFEDIDP